jgi:hypothetical protein
VGRVRERRYRRSPLRTVRVSFPTHNSSLQQTPRTGRSCLWFPIPDYVLDDGNWHGVVEDSPASRPRHTILVPDPSMLGVAVWASRPPPPSEEEATLSRKLRTPRLPATHVPVGYGGQHRR